MYKIYHISRTMQYVCIYKEGGLVYLNCPSRHREKSDLTVSWNLLSFRDCEISGYWTVVFREMAEHRYFLRKSLNFGGKYEVLRILRKRRTFSERGCHFCEFCEKDARFQKGDVIFVIFPKRRMLSEGEGMGGGVILRFLRKRHTFPKGRICFRRKC